MSHHSRQPVVSPIVVPELEPPGAAAEPRPIDMLADVPGTVTVVAGRAEMSLDRIRSLQVGDIVALDRSPDATVDIYVNGTHVARGDVIVIDEAIAARVTELDRDADRRR